MQMSVIYQASELSPEARRAVELLLGHGLDGDEKVSGHASSGRVIHEALTGQPREVTFQRFIAPESEIDAAIDEAVDYVGHHRE